jgi:L-2-hydroxyglutarate oxidase
VKGGREVGPNAVLALRREGYRRGSFSLPDALDVLSYPGFHRFVAKNLCFTAGEFASSLNENAFVAKAKKMIPDIRREHLVSGSAGVRAQALSMDGSLLMDFRILRHGRQVHVLNAPSPGATASLAIAAHIVDEYIN